MPDDPGDRIERPDPDDASDRIEREINEILDKIEHFPSPESRRARARRRTARRIADAVAARQRTVLAWSGRFSISQVMLLSFLLILGSFFFRRFSPAFMQWVLIAGVVLFVSSFALFIFGGRGVRGGGGGPGRPRTPESRYWRGRELDYSATSLGTRFRRWLGNLRRR